MKIKDVEKLTGLTAKSIRYYEAKNLIAVKRNEENSYRNYTDEDVTRLKWIKMYRYLDFSIKEIERLLTMGADEIKKALNQKADAFSEQENLCEVKRSLCQLLAKDYENSEAVVEEYNDTIEFLESDEMSDLKEQVKDFTAPNLITTIAETLIFMAPVFSLFYNIQAERTDMLMFNGIIAIICTALTTWNWIHYANQCKKNREWVKRKNRKMIWLLPAMIAAFIWGIAAVIAVTALLSKWVLPDNYLFFEHGSITEMALVLLVILPAILFCVLVVAKIQKVSLFLHNGERQAHLCVLLFLFFII